MNRYIIDTEVHLMHPESIDENFAKGTSEPVRKAIHEHSDYPGIKKLMTLDALRDSMKQNNIRHCHIMGMSWRNKQWNDANNRYIEDCVEKIPGLFSGFYIPHLEDVSIAVEDVMLLDNQKFLGVKMLPLWQGRSVNERELYPIFEAIQQKELFLMVHTDHLTQSSDGDTPQKLLELVRNFPNLKVLAPHLGGLLCMYHLLPQYATELKNVTYIGSVSATMLFVKHAAEIDENNILFGSDFPFNHCHNQSSQIKELKNLGLSQRVLQKIFSENAERLFNYKFSVL